MVTEILLGEESLDEVSEVLMEVRDMKDDVGEVALLCSENPLLDAAINTEIMDGEMPVSCPELPLLDVSMVYYDELAAENPLPRTETPE
jgi:hypothetical protein